MGVKILNFKVNLKSTTPELIYSRHKVYTNDDNAVKLEFAIQDFTTEELTAATASLLLYMRDGSFFQIEDANITKSGSTFSYTLQGTQGKHDGVAQAQLLVTIGAAELATQKYEFEIISGLDQAVAVEVMIQDWTTLTAEARAFIDQAELDEAQRITNENERIANENERIAAENQRINDFSSKADKSYVDQQDSALSAQLAEKVQNFKIESLWGSYGSFDIPITEIVAIYAKNDNSFNVGSDNIKLFNLVLGHKYYVKIELHEDTQVNIDRISLGNTFVSGLNSKKISAVGTISGTSANYLYTQSVAGQTGTLKYKSGLVVNLTSVFGAGNEPTKIEMDELIKIIPNQWWDGELSLTQKQVVTWMLNLQRKTTNAVIALGGTII